jgi:methionine biosynthesis protein MetW
MLKTARHNLALRQDLLIISEMIPNNAQVLDLGCGNGGLLHVLKEDKNIYACGVEISQDKIIECVNKGVPVIHSDLNDGLSEFANNAFDFVVLSQTLQAVQRPDKLLGDMMRIADKGLVSFMNIGYWGSRFQLLFKGKMPITNTLPHNWYDTPNIHLATIKDFRNLCRASNIKIIKEIPFGKNLNFFTRAFPNILAPTCVFLIEKQRCLNENS